MRKRESERKSKLRKQRRPEDGCSTTLSTLSFSWASLAVGEDGATDTLWHLHHGTVGAET